MSELEVDSPRSRRAAADGAIRACPVARHRHNHPNQIHHATRSQPGTEWARKPTGIRPYRAASRPSFTIARCAGNRALQRKRPHLVLAQRPLAMQKVVGSSPIIRFEKPRKPPGFHGEAAA